MRFTRHPLSGNKVSGRDFSNVPIDAAVTKRLRESLKHILAQPDKLADRFYMRLFDLYPGVRPLFRADMSAQQKKLTQTLEWVVDSLDRPDQVREAARELGARHETYGAKPEHYPIVCDLLVDTMGQIAGKQWTEELAADWKQALELLSELMTGQASIRRPTKDKG